MSINLEQTPPIDNPPERPTDVFARHTSVLSPVPEFDLSRFYDLPPNPNRIDVVDLSSMAPAQSVFSESVERRRTPQAGEGVRATTHDIIEESHRINHVEGDIVIPRPETPVSSRGRPKADYEKLRENEQSRKRMEEKRRRGKELLPTPQEDSRLNPLVYEGLGATCRSLAQYNDELLKWMVSVGFALSAAGASAPIASIVSTVSHNAGESSVELFSKSYVPLCTSQGFGYLLRRCYFPAL